MYVTRNPWVPPCCVRTGFFSLEMRNDHSIHCNQTPKLKSVTEVTVLGRLPKVPTNFQKSLSRICWYLLIVIEYKGISLKQFQNLTGKTAVSNHQLTIYDLWNYHLWSPGKHGKVATNLPRTTPWHWWEMLVLAVDESNHPRCSLGV